MDWLLATFMGAAFATAILGSIWLWEKRDRW
jgi:hypothetical protein